nr:MAG TPA: hypothetical protein [Crassvirales sp.]
MFLPAFFIVFVNYLDCLSTAIKFAYNFTFPAIFARKRKIYGI